MPLFLGLAKNLGKALRDLRLGWALTVGKAKLVAELNDQMVTRLDVLIKVLNSSLNQIFFAGIDTPRKPHLKSQKYFSRDDVWRVRRNQLSV